MRLALNFFLAFSLTSCASLSHQPAKTIAFSDIEKLNLGKTTKEQILSLFGKPTGTLHRSNTQEALVYDGVLSTGNLVQKASFSFDDGKLIGVFWMPYDSDKFQNVKALQDHFKSARFVRKVKGWDKQGHSYSDEVRYYDPEKGISFTTDADKTVSWITFTLPSQARDISSKE